MARRKQIEKHASSRRRIFYAPGDSKEQEYAARNMNEDLRLVIDLVKSGACYAAYDTLEDALYKSSVTVNRVAGTPAAIKLIKNILVAGKAFKRRCVRVTYTERKKNA